MNGWNIMAGVSTLLSKVPVERLLTRDRTKDFDEFEERLKGKGLLASSKGSQTGTATVTNPLAPTQSQSRIASETPSEASALPLATTQETIADLEKRLAKEVYRFQLDLAAGCKIAGKPCDCCEKHPIFAIESMVEELVPMDPDNPTYAALGQWIKANEHKLTLEASASGKYDQEYPHMAATMRAFRKNLLGTEDLSAMITAPQTISLEEAKEEAARIAAERVEKEWESTEKT